jgi:hypothetical protein
MAIETDELVARIKELSDDDHREPVYWSDRVADGSIEL